MTGDHAPVDVNVLAYSEAGAAGAAPALRLRGVTRRFGPVIANDEVDLDVYAGEVHALLGENGAGKSTLMNIVFGSVASDAGTLEVDGEPVPWPSTRQAIERGICMVHQHLMLVPTLTVAENVLLSVMWTERGRRMSLDEAARRVTELGERHGLPLDTGALVDDLSIGEKLRLEIVRSLLQGEIRGGLRVLILDEPTGLLTRQEIERLFSILRNLAAGGTAVVIITHKLNEVMEVSDRVTVLRDARRVRTMPTSATSQRELGTLMVGRELRPRTVTHARPDGPAVLEVSELGVADHHRVLLEDIGFVVRGGEILGVAGVAGSGQDVLAECITGLRRSTSGSIRLAGRDVTRLDRRDLIENEVAHVPEDRKVDGLVGSASLRHNFILGLHRWSAFQRRGWMRARAIDDHATRLAGLFEIRMRGIDQPAQALSGGNQQRVLLGRELHKDASLIVACGPTRGLDIAGTEYVWNRLVEQRDRGAAVLLVSLDLDELLALSDRLIVMHGGRVVGALTSAEADPETLGLMMGGGTMTAVAS